MSSPTDRIAHSTVSRGSTESWTDHKRYLWLIGLVVPSLAFVAFGMNAATGWGVWWWIGPIVVFGVVPLLAELQPRVLYGSDFPTLPFAYADQLDDLARLGLGDDWLRDVCWHNGLRLFQPR